MPSEVRTKKDVADALKLADIKMAMKYFSAVSPSDLERESFNGKPEAPVFLGSETD